MNELSIQIPSVKPIDGPCSFVLGPITWFVGPNASGKTRIAEAMVNALGGATKARLLRADRLSGLDLHRSGYFSSGHFTQGFQRNSFQNIKSEAQQHGYGADAIVLLEENRTLRAIVEATLSQIFGRRVLFEWDSGILEPKILQKGKGNYSLHKNECHGLKELVVLLTHLYDPTKEVLIIDEPELNLHPQYQGFILEHFQAAAKAGRKRVILITHSPYMMDIKTDTDLCFIYCFNPDGQPPNRVSALGGIEASRVRRCISQMNAHHRQLFFAHYVALTEGVYDRLIMSALLARSGVSIAAAGGTIVDVNGKEDMPFYLRLCDNLGKKVFVFCDLDGLFDGSVRRILSGDDQLKSALSNLGGGLDVQSYIGTIQRELHELQEQLTSLSKTTDLMVNIKKRCPKLASQATNWRNISQKLSLRLP